MSFQDELRNCIPAETEIRQEKNEQVQREVEQVYSRIKGTLMTKAAQKEYSVCGGMAVVSCVVNMPKRYLQIKSWNNFDQVGANNRRLFKDPFLKPRASKIYSVNEEYREEYELFCSLLRERLRAEQISFSMILNSLVTNRERPFPTELTGAGECSVSYLLAVKCSTSFSL